MKKLLFISNVTNKMTNFVLPSYYASKKLGYRFYMASNLRNFDSDGFYNDVHYYSLDIQRNPFDPKNIVVANKLRKLIEKEKFDAIHCNTPTGGLLGRVIGSLTHVPKIIYTAHGFHFYKGAPLLNHLFYKNAEKIMAKHTDVLITMNNEDYKAAENFSLRNEGNLYKVSGVGIDLHKFNNKDLPIKYLIEELHLTKNDYVLLAVGDLIKRKNFETAIKAVYELNNPNVKLFICGEGEEYSNLNSLIENLNLENQVKLLGFRNDVANLINISDVFLFPTYQEGLPRALMEAMAAGLPCVASNVRGNNDLIVNGRGGFLVDPHTPNTFASAIQEIISNKVLASKMGSFNQKYIQNFSSDRVKKEIFDIYSQELP